MAPITEPDLSRFPPELFRAVAEGAERNADRVGQFLAGVGLAPQAGQVRLAPQAGQVRRLPADFLLDLGAALRMLSWEHAGFEAHLEATPARAAREHSRGWASRSAASACRTLAITRPQRLFYEARSSE